MFFWCGTQSKTAATVPLTPSHWRGDGAGRLPSAPPLHAQGSVCTRLGKGLQERTQTRRVIFLLKTMANSLPSSA